MGRLRNLNLGHGFLHPQNWSAVGTVYDLDSVYGPVLGDGRQPSNDKFAEDAMLSMIDISKVIQNGLDQIKDIEMPNIDMEKLNKDAWINLLKSYSREIKDKAAMNETLVKIKEQLLEHPDIPSKSFVNEFWEELPSKI